jgi:imidazolonepropionase-like amidohydrolase
MKTNKMNFKNEVIARRPAAVGRTTKQSLLRGFGVPCLLVALSLAFTIARAGTGEVPPKPQSHPIAIVGGTIHPVSGPVIENGTIIFDKGKITAIGANVTVPQGTETIDAKGMQVYPGMVAATSDLGLTEIQAVRATNDLSEVGNIDPNVRPEVSVNPESELIPVTRVNGITTAVTMMNGGTFSGSAAAMNLDGWTWVDMTLRAPVGMCVNWPNMTINHAAWERRSEDDQKKERDKALNELRGAFKDARAYLAAKKADANGGAHQPTDVRWDAMAPVLEGKIPVLMSAEEITQIEAAVAWADEEKVKMVIMGGYDAWRAADQLKAKNIPVVVNPILRLPWRRQEEYDQAQLLPKKLFDAGVKFCIAADAGDPSNLRNLPYHAAMAVGHGLPKDEGLKAITEYPAEIMGIADRVGTLEVGKDANIIITNGDLLEISTNLTHEYIEGKDIPLTTHHTRLNDKYRTKYQQLKEESGK